MLPPEQITQIRENIIQQVESTYPEDKKVAAKQQIQSMNDEQFEEFLKQNNLIKTTEGETSSQQCIFCSIVAGNVPTKEIGANEKAIATLEINPISQAHTIIIPKEHITNSEQLPKEAFSLAEEVAKKIKDKLKPKDVQISTANVFGHEIINVLPIYKDETINSERKQAKPEELEQVQEMLKTKPKPKVIKKARAEKLDSKKLWLPKRIP
jgi:diadenosine tetraphosphate (Ap4A) HIT family hydrolase